MEIQLGQCLIIDMDIIYRNLNDFDNMDGKRRLELALENIAKYSEVDRIYLFDNTYKLLNPTQREIFIEEVI